MTRLKAIGLLLVLALVGWSLGSPAHVRASDTAVTKVVALAGACSTPTSGAGWGCGYDPTPTSTTSTANTRHGEASNERANAGGSRSSTFSSDRVRATKGAPPAARVAASVDDVSRSAASPYSATSPGLSRAGQSLSKHQRRGGPYPPATGRPEAISRQAEDVVDEVLTNPQSSFTTRQTGRFGEVVDVQVPGGPGVRYSERNGFLHFLEPPR